MSNLDPSPDEQVCRAGGAPECTNPTPKHPDRTTTDRVETPASAADSAPEQTYADVEIVTHRMVPLGGPRAIEVRRTLPQRKRSLIGAWCFADHFGPSNVAESGGMDVAPHPHTGLQTVSWLFTGEVEHIDSGDNRGLVRPGEVNLMTSGAGICHSETSTKSVSTLHGVQLWIALPDGVRQSAPRSLEHYEPKPATINGGAALVFIGSLAGSTSPIKTHTPLVGAELRIDAQSSITLDIDPSFEHGVLIDEGDITVEDTAVPKAAIAYTGLGARKLRIRNDSPSPARLILIGGEPFAEEIVMWWNFVGRSSEEISHFREEWQARTERFGHVKNYVGHGGPNKNAEGQSWLPAPKLPNVVIKPRKNPVPHARPGLTDLERNT